MSKRLPWIAIAVLVVLVAALRWRFVDVPLERDEGEYAYAGQLILRGEAPYANLYNMKLPGTYAAYAAIVGIFGESHRGVHLGFLLVNALTVVLVFLLARRLFGDLAAWMAAGAFALLSVGRSVLGIAANAEHFVLPPVLLGLLVLLPSLEKGCFRGHIGAGLLLGTGFLAKQHGAAFVLLGLALVVSAAVRARPGWGRGSARVAAFGLAAVLPYGATLLLFWMLGAFDELWFWTVEYARAYTEQVPLARAWDFFTRSGGRVFRDAPALWALSAIGLTSLAWAARARGARGFLLAFLLFSFLALCPGFLFRHHYFVLFLPVAALCFGLGVSAVGEALSRTRLRERGRVVAATIGVVCLASFVLQHNAFLFRWSTEEITRKTYGKNPFWESLEIADFVRERTAPGDRIAVVGSEPQIYFYARRRAATGYIYTYALMEAHDYAREMQLEMIREIEANDPELLVYVLMPTSWAGRKESPTDIFSWFERYKRGFTLAGVVDTEAEEPRLIQGEELARMGRPPEQGVHLYVRRR